MWRMKKMKWVDRVHNEEAMIRIKKNRIQFEFFNTVLKRKRNWIGHIIKGKGIVRAQWKRKDERKEEIKVTDDVKDERIYK